jgi:hypothetical protein
MTDGSGSDATRDDREAPRPPGPSVPQVLYGPPPRWEVPGLADRLRSALAALISWFRRSP